MAKSSKISETPEGNVVVTDDPVTPTSSAPPEGDPAPDPTTPPTPGFSAEDVEKARKQEKDKLYPELESLRSQLAEFTKREEDRKKAEDAARAKAEADAKKAAEAELSAKELLEQRQTEWEKRFTEMQSTWESRLNEEAAKHEAEKALLEKDRQYAALQAYTQRRIQDESDGIAPELRDLIGGNTQEEVDRSIEVMKAKTQQIAEAMRETVTRARAQQRGVSATGYSALGPLDQEATTRTYSAEDIKAMNMTEYAKLRSKMGIDRDSSNRGLFG